jgi:crossover junction endodeoxyribonuclease RuvC
VATGYGLIEPGPQTAAIVATGVIVTDSDRSLEARLQQIYDGVDRLLAEHMPGSVVIEDLYAEYSFPRTALLMAHARGVICLAAEQHKVPVLALAPAVVKRAIAAHGMASKAQIQEGVRRLLRLPVAPRPSHVADALALALTGFSRAGGRLA